jgi:hypoxanthine phosphoribosyltransferase
MTLTANPSMAKQHLQTLWSEAQVQARIAELAMDISLEMGGGTPGNPHGGDAHGTDPHGGNALVCLVVLGGGFFFAADLIRQLRGFDKIEIEHIRISSYEGTASSGRVTFHTALPTLAGRKVLVIEDLLDTGLTMSRLRDELSRREVTDVRYAVLVDKPARRAQQFLPHYVGFRCDTDAYLVGCGMDMHGGLRELPYIAAVQDDPVR